MSRRAKSSAFLDELVAETPGLLARLDAPPVADQPVPTLPISDISPDPRQPRRHIRQETLLALAEDIRRVGILQPVVVRPATDWNGFTLVFGERRYRAALMIGLTHLPAVIRRDLSDADVLELQWQENAQREDVDDIDKAIHLKRWKEMQGLSWTEMAAVTRLSRRHILRMQQMAEMPDSILDLVREKRLSPSHIYQLTRVSSEEQQIKLAEQAAEQHWSVAHLNSTIIQTSKPESIQACPPSPWVALADTLKKQVATPPTLTEQDRALLEEIGKMALTLASVHKEINATTTGARQRTKQR